MLLPVVLAILLIGCLVLYLSFRRLVQAESQRLRAEIQAQVEIFFDRYAQLRNELAELRTKAVDNEARIASGSTVKRGLFDGGSDEISPGTLAAIHETVSGLVGKKVRVLSANPVAAPGGEQAALWAHQGRMQIHASREIVQRGS